MGGFTGCTCGAWMSVTPPPPCPVHTYTNNMAPGTSRMWVSQWGVRGEPCRGRHCKHDMICGSWREVPNG